MRARRPEGAPGPIEVFKEIRSYMHTWNQAPTVRELADFLECGNSTIQRAIDALERDGVIRRRARVSRGITITEKGIHVSA
jgi:DNA-binding transcriptional regulator YhcF (GntR family)